MDGAFRLADPWLLALLVLVPVAWAVARVVGRRRGSGSLRISTVAPLRDLPRSRRLRYRWVISAIRFTAAALLVVALARPQIGRASARIPTQGIDVVLALDISGSMQDPGLSAGSKLDGAKQAIKEFISQRKNDRVGFVIFESESKVVSPLTLDYKALETLVDKVRNGDSPPDGTAIGLGIADAVNLLRESRAKSRVVILATDGENNQHRVEPDQAAGIAKQLGMKLYTIGMLASNETATTSEIDEKSMRQWAQETGGFYGRAQTGAQLRHIFDTISRLETSQIERTHYTSFDELAGYLIVPALGLLMVEVALRGTFFRQAP